MLNYVLIIMAFFILSVSGYLCGKDQGYIAGYAEGYNQGMVDERAADPTTQLTDNDLYFFKLRGLD